jgi:hypothetical protein
MTPEQQRIAIATACGWRIVQTTKYAWVVICPSKIERAWSSHDGVMNDKPASYYLPDYLNDLNAMHEAEKVLTPKHQPDKGESQWGEYLGWLGFCGENKIREVYECVTATAAQRAQAFLRTLNLWTPTPTQPQ